MPVGLRRRFPSFPVKEEYSNYNEIWLGAIGRCMGFGSIVGSVHCGPP